MAKLVPFAILAIFSPLSAVSAADQGAWAVGDCILAQFSLNFTVFLDKSGSANNSEVISVPADAKVDNDQSTCGDPAQKNPDQKLRIYWTEKQKNDSSIDLKRDVTITFRRNLTESYYGVERVYCIFELGTWNVKSNNTTTAYNTTAVLDSQDVEKLMFHTPLDRSFTCKDLGDFQLKTQVFYSNTKIPALLPNSTVSASGLKFDAFRVTGQKPPPAGFRSPLDCDYQPNDIVPIAVGVALAVLVIVVLVAYMVGRRRNRQRGYQSV